MPVTLMALPRPRGELSPALDKLGEILAQCSVFCLLIPLGCHICCNKWFLLSGLEHFAQLLLLSLSRVWSWRHFSKDVCCGAEPLFRHQLQECVFKNPLPPRGFHCTAYGQRLRKARRVSGRTLLLTLSPLHPKINK